MPSYLVDQLSTWCRLHPFRRKVLFVPSAQVGYNITTALARAGTSWVNLDAVTPEAEAARLVEPLLQSTGWRRLPQDGDLLLVEQLLPKIARDAGGYFAGAEWGPGLVRSFVHTMRALRLAGIKPDELGRRIKNEKGGAVAHCFAAYICVLQEEQLYDRAHLLQRALEDKARDATATYAVLDETELPHLAFRYVQFVAASDLWRIGRDSYVQPAPAHFAASRFARQPRPKATSTLGCGARLLAGESLSREEMADVRVREVHGPENEVRGVFRDLLGRGIRLDEVEIAYTSESPYLTLLIGATDRFDLAGGDDQSASVTFAAGIPARHTHPGQALLGWLEWIEQGFDARVLIRLCRAGLFTFEDGSGLGQPLSPQEVGEVLAWARIGRGEASYHEALERLLKQRREDLLREQQQGRSTTDLEEDIARLEAVKRIIMHLFELTPGAGATSMAAMAEAGIAFLETCTPNPARWARDRRELRSLVDRLNELGERLPGQQPRSRLARMLRDLFVDHTGEAATARGATLYVTPLERAGYAGRPHLYVLGVDEDSFPGTPAEDPILLDDERKRFGPRLSLHRTKPGEKQWHLERVLATATGSVTLSACTRHLSDGRERRLSPVLQQLPLSANELTSIPPAEQAVTDTELLLAAREQEGFQAVLNKTYPWLVTGHRAMEARDGNDFTRFDGIVGEYGPELDPLNGNHVLSASRLEMLSRCPYRYFLRYGLRVNVPGVEEPDPSQWLDPLQFGSLLHDLYAEFMQRLTDRGERVNVRRHEPEMLELLEGYIDAHRKAHPPPYDAAYRSDCKRLQLAARIFLAIEEDRDARPVGFEVSFGFGEDEGLHHPAPVRIHLDDDLAFELRGRIDRIDRRAKGYELWDYKTGSTTLYNDQDVLCGGRFLQWALYAYALEEILRAGDEETPVLRSGYVFASGRGHGRRIYDTAPPRQALADRLRPLFQMVREGAFPHIHATDNSQRECDYCDFNRLCADEQVEGRAAFQEVADVLDEKLPFAEPLQRWMQR